MIHRVLVYHTCFNWSLVSVCQHVLCVVFVVCYISPPVVSLAASVLFKAMAALASVWFNGKQTYH